MFLQRRLEECLQKQEEIQLALDVTKEDTEKEKKENQRERRDWEQEREAMKEEISELRENMRENSEALRKMEGKHKVHTRFRSAVLLAFLWINKDTWCIIIFDTIPSK